MITNDAWRTRGVKSSIASIQQEEGRFHQQTGLKFMEESLYGAGIWTFGRSEILGTFWSVLENDGEDLWDR